MTLDLGQINKQFPASAEYLSSIYLLQRDYGVAGNTRLAAWMGVSGSAVTQALGRLKRLRLARQERYGHIALTEKGRTLALTVLRRHYLLEHLLVRILKYPWEKADDEAKRLQNQISEDFAEHLYSVLGSPQTCPHGNPLPGCAVEGKLLKAPKLAHAPIGQVVEILRITEEGEQIPSLLTICFAQGIQPEARFLVKSRNEENINLERVGPPVDPTKPTEVTLSLDKAEHIRYESEYLSTT